MEPTIKDGEFFLVSKINKPKVNDIVVLMHPEKNICLVKRVKAELGSGDYLVEGDNAGHSRKFSAKKAQIVGKLSFCYWPLQKIGFVG